MNNKFLTRRTMYESGMSIKAIAKELSITPGAVRQSLLKAGTKMRTLEEVNKSKIPLQSIINDYEYGMSCIQIAKKYGYRNTGIGAILKRNNIKIRTPQDNTSYDWSFIYNKNDRDFFMYWLGWMLSDGCVHHTVKNNMNRGIRAIILINIRDKFILEFFRDNIDKNRPIVSPGKLKSAVRLNISLPRKDAKFLEEYGLVPAKSLVLKPTEKLWNLCRSDFMQLLVGLVEGDGTVRIAHKKYRSLSISLFSGSKEWLEFIRDKLYEFGYAKRKVCNRKSRSGFRGKHENKVYNSYNYSISGKDAILLGKEILTTNYHLLSRKWDIISFAK